MSFVDANNGWYCTTNGGVYRTSTGGTSWTKQTITGLTSTLYGIWFTDTNNGWLVTTAGGVYHTSNGGTNWAKQTLSPTTTQQLRGVYFTSALVGWVTGAGGVVYHTTNGGTTWTQQTSTTTTQTLYSVYATDANNAWAVGGGGVIDHTTNGGTTWAAQTSNTTQALRSVRSAGGSLWASGAGGVCQTYLIDATPPVTTASGLQAGPTTGWQTSGQTVTLAASDAQSGVSATYYKLDGGAQQTYSAPFAVSTQGSHSVVYWSVDKGGNTEAQRTGYVNIDATAPATTTSNLQGSATSGWQTAGQTVTLTATDAVSGVATTTYTVDGVSQLYAGPFLVASSGSHGITYWSTDNAGNAETRHQGYVNIDTTAPTTTATGLQASAATGWQNVSQVVSLAGSDTLSGVAATYYTVDTGARQAYTSAFAIATQGSHKVTYWSVDAIGNTETPAGVGYVNIDTTAPTVSDSSDGAWHNKPVTVALTPVDTGGSNLASTQYKLQGASSWSAATGNQFTVPAPADHSGDGVHVYQYRALDNAGNSSTIGNCTVWIDTTPPTTTAVGLALDDLSGWRTTSQTVSLSADDGAGSGVTAISYTLDNGGAHSYSAPFAVSSPGQHPVTYYATDAAGNVETAHAGWVNISNPYAQATTNLAPDGQSDWQKQATTVTISGAGDHAPISVSYGIDAATPQKVAGNPASFTVSTEGSHPVTFFATNGLGLDSLHETGFVNIDLTAPVTIAGGLQSTRSTGWQTGGQTVTLQATDNLSGLSARYYTVDQGSAQIYTGPFLVAGEGSHEVVYWSVDAAGNIETHGGQANANTGYVNIDSTPPATTATNLQSDRHSGWTASGQSVGLSAGDTGSGMSGGSAATYYTIDGGSTQTYAAPITVTGAGSHTIVYWSVDAVGNVEQHDVAHNTGYVNVDGTPPTTTPTGLQANAHSGWQASGQTVSLAASDATSGMSGGAAVTYYTIDGGARQTYSAPFNVGGEGSHAVVYWSVDAAGNIETHDATHNTGYVNIDSTPPATIATNLQTSATTGWTKAASVSVGLSASDATSGMSGGAAVTYYTIDGGGTQTYSTPFAVSGEGSHTIVYWSVDAAGDVETHDVRTTPAT